MEPYPLIKREKIDDDTTLEYLLYEGDGPTILFLNGTGFSPWLFHPVARRLSNQFRIIVPFLNEHREAEPEEGGLKWKLLADDFCKFCHRLDLERSYLTAHSMGATVATIAAYFEPDLAKKMIMMEPIYLPETLYTANLSVEQHPLASKSIKRRNEWQNRGEAREYLRSRALYKSWDTEVLEMFLQYGMVEDDHGIIRLACSPRHEAALFMGGLHFNPWPLLSGIKCPVLVLEGAESENRSFIDLSKAASLMPHSEHRLLEGVGHTIPMEIPARTAGIIKDFLIS
ncbi:MAG TPA: alpha/beta hydrolase [Syntrophomonas sp.]|nr:alpha/beta hydrolase [Syntrophomonas sp.]